MIRVRGRTLCNLTMGDGMQLLRTRCRRTWTDIVWFTAKWLTGNRDKRIYINSDVGIVVTGRQWQQAGMRGLAEITTYISTLEIEHSWTPSATEQAFVDATDAGSQGVAALLASNKLVRVA